MNRIEFIAELEKLLQDISPEERKEAIQYYKDYFEDAGLEQEQYIIEELGSPKKVADTIKEGLRGGIENENFTGRELVVRGATYRQETKQEKKKPWSSQILKIFLIIAIFIVGAPVVVPIALIGLAIILGIVFSGFLILGGLVVAAIAAVIGGGIMVVSGVMEILHFPALGMFVFGMGLIIAVLGLVATVLFVKACLIIFPKMFRCIVNICRRPIHGKEA